MADQVLVPVPGACLGALVLAQPSQQLKIIAIVW